MKILVTGGFGFIGSHLAEALIGLGHKIRVLDNRDRACCRKLVFPGIINDTHLEILQGDITDLEICMEAVAGVEAVFHTAAITLVRESYEDPEKTYKVNVTGTENLLKATVHHNVKKLIYSSTGKIYASNGNVLSKETSPLNPVTPYAQTKYKAETFLKSYVTNKGLNIISLRYFSIYGPRMKLFGGLIGDILKSTLNGRKSRIDATPSMARDFTYISDVIQGNLLCLEAPVDGYEIFNIASGVTKTVDDLVQFIQKCCGENLTVSYGDILEGMAFTTQADITKAKKKLGYEPKVQLEEGLRRTIAWMKENSLLESSLIKK